MKKMTAQTVVLKELLVEMLNKLSSDELDKFKSFIELEDFDSRGRLKVANTQDVVELMVEVYSQECVEVTRDVLKKMNRSDLVQRLSERSSGATGESSIVAQTATLIQKEEMIVSVIELLLETLANLSDTEMLRFRFFLSNEIHWHSPSSSIPWERWNTANMQGTVFLLVQTFGQQSLRKTEQVLETMNRADLIQKLSDSSSGHTKKLSVDEDLSAQIHKAATMAAVKELLSETLTRLSVHDLEKFKWFLPLTCFQKSLPWIPSRRLQMADSADQLVDMLVEKYGRQSLELTIEVLMDINKTDLVQSLQEANSELKGKLSVHEHCPVLIQKEEMMVSVIELLLETLANLSDTDILRFRFFLSSEIHRHSLSEASVLYTGQIYAHGRNRAFHRHGRSSSVPWERWNTANMQDTVFLLVQTFGQQSLRKTEKILEKMNRADLIQKLSDSSSGHTKKLSVDEHLAAVIQKVATMAAVIELLSEMLGDLGYQEYLDFRKHLRLVVSKKDRLDPSSWLLFEDLDDDDIVDPMVDSGGLQFGSVVWFQSDISSGFKVKNQSPLSHEETETMRGLQRDRVQMARRAGIVKLMVQTYGEQSIEVTKECLKKINRTDLVQKLSDTSSGSKGPSRSLELEGCNCSWTKLEPEVNNTDTDEAPTYSLQSEAGNFECSVSGLRWVCEENVSFKYQFHSWEGHMERMESMQYMPAGPLIDITVITGKLNEVYLPHWICIDDNPAISDKFAVLHIDACGDVVEEVSEVTTSHVKLSEPVFSPRGILMKAGFPVKINCNVLIYQTNTAFLTLHVYLIPRDPGLQQAIDKRELSYGYKIIRKPHPEKSLKMHECFILTADLDGAEICPETLKLRYESRGPNFFEMFIENPSGNFKLSLIPEGRHEPVWTCAIRKDEYQRTGNRQGMHFVDKQRDALIARVSNIQQILDKLLAECVIQQEEYDQVRALPTTQEMMRKLYSGPLKAGGHESKDIFYKILEDTEPLLVSDLQRS